MKKIFLAVTFVSILNIADAGTSRSLGGHSMVNARNSSMGRSIGGHTSSQGKSFAHKVGNYIKAHGGTVTVTHQNAHGTLDVTTGKGGTFSAVVNDFSYYTGYFHKTSELTYQATATTAKGNYYEGNGFGTLNKYIGQDTQSSITFEGNHSGFFSGNQGMVVSGSLSADLNQTSPSVKHQNTEMALSGQVLHQSTLSASKNDLGQATANRKENNDYTGSQGNTLKSATETVVTKGMDSETIISHPDSESQYVLLNGEPISH